MRSYPLKIRSRHETHRPLRGMFRFPFRSVLRLGSVTPLTSIYPSSVNLSEVIEINTPEAVANSANKELMKRCFTKDNIKTADWFIWSKDTNDCFVDMKRLFNPQYEGDGEDLKAEDLPYPIVAKHIFGSRGTGNYLLKNADQLKGWMQGRDLSKYIFERFFAKGREYRLHMTKDGCFYTCRKLLKQDATERWRRHDDNCVWYMEDNPKFDKPVNWDVIVEECKKAVVSLGLDICCFDVKVQTAKNKHGEVRSNPDFIIIESGSAPSFGEVTTQKYMEQIPKLIINKYYDSHRKNSEADSEHNQPSDGINQISE